jgi:alpha-L-fucosidase
MKKSDNSTAVYAIFLRWPDDNTLALGAPDPTFQTRATMLGFGQLPWTFSTTPGVGMFVNLPTVPFTKLPSTWAWTIKLEYLFN